MCACVPGRRGRLEPIRGGRPRSQTVSLSPSSSSGRARSANSRRCQSIGVGDEPRPPPPPRRARHEPLQDSAQHGARTMRGLLSFICSAGAGKLFGGRRAPQSPALRRGRRERIGVTKARAHCSACICRRARLAAGLPSVLLFLLLLSLRRARLEQLERARPHPSRRPECKSLGLDRAAAAAELQAQKRALIQLHII
jgi:hypothetical protein